MTEQTGKAEFFERTIRNWNAYKAMHEDEDCRFQYEETQRVNSLLGIIVFVKEEELLGNGNNANLDDFVSRNTPRLWEYGQWKHKKGRCVEETKNFANYLKHLRNAIAHANVELLPAANDNKPPGQREITRLRFRDENRCRCGTLHEFEHTLELQQVEELIRLITKAMSIDPDAGSSVS